MKEMEVHLKELLRRQPPSAGFTDRVIRRVTGRGKPRLAWWATGAIAATLLVLGGRLEYQRYRSEQAKQELMQALEITAEKLVLVESHLENLRSRRWE
ncbi:MAG: hypothetical protein FJW20_19950 [Acidimicrobiia bacterium]|nr:hypothetical protein [Acidimicrobiia bacterium]